MHKRIDGETLNAVPIWRLQLENGDQHYQTSLKARPL